MEEIGAYNMLCGKRRIAQNGRLTSTAGNGCSKQPARHQRECTPPTVSRSSSTTREKLNGYAPLA
eukprot:2768947-Heterocapsa_arctica.AAC.1